MAERSPTRLDVLERRMLLSGPSPREEQLLELVNRFRTRPAQELPLLLNSKDPDIDGALSYFGVNRQVLASQWKSLTPQEPLAWSDALARAALGHNQRMLAAQAQAHQLAGEAALVSRTSAAGYANAAFVGENVFAWAKSANYAHAGFAVDWGNSADGIQDPPDHRENLMAGVYREVGISMLDAPAGKSVGPILVTQNFGVRRDQSNPLLVGAVFNDANRDGFYTAGEGLANVTVVAAGKTGVFSTTSLTAGGYQVALPAGTYTLSAAGAGGVSSLGTVTIGQQNQHRDFIKSQFQPDTSPPAASFKVVSPAAGGQTSMTFSVTFRDNGAMNASTIDNRDLMITGPGGAILLPQLVTMDRRINSPAITGTYRFTAPGGFFDSLDNGTYTVSVIARRVADVNGLYVPAKAVGTFSISAAPVVLTLSGTLQVNGGAGNDAISAWRDSTRVYARVNGGTWSFDAGGVKRIVAMGLAGNDTIKMGRNLVASTLDGGPGNDALYGTDGADTLLGQEGSDVIYGYSGNDVFRAMAGRDTIYGGAGYDSAERDAADVVKEVERVV